MIYACHTCNCNIGFEGLCNQCRRIQRLKDNGQKNKSPAEGYQETRKEGSKPFERGQEAR